MKTSSMHNSFDLLIIRNDGPAIASTNYWTDSFDDSGKFVVSHNIDFRILLPESFNNQLQEMATGRNVIVSRGPWGLIGGQHGIEILFDDDSDQPFQITTAGDAVPTLPKPGENFQVTVWTRGPGDQAIRRLSLPGRYRHVQSIPCRQRWLPRHSKPLFNF